ncbi:MAG: glycosyltransferase family 2 protein [Hyphomicrobium sp.]
MSAPQLSIVSTLYRSAPFLQEFYTRVKASAESLGPSFEIVLVNDGSPDESLAMAHELAARDPRVRVINLSRNFGHHVAAFAAIEAAKGERVFLIDSDLEEHPEWLKLFSNVMDEKNADVVYGVQTKRSGLIGGLFYKLFNMLSSTPIPANACTVRLMRRAYVDALLLVRDRNMFMAGSFMWVGFQQVGVKVSKGTRREGRSTYSLTRQIALFVNALTSFSAKPLYAAFFAGAVFASTAAVVGLGLILRKILYPDTVIAGFTSLIVSIIFMGGLIIFFIGLIGIYIAKMFIEVKNRPLYITCPPEQSAKTEG